MHDNERAEGKTSPMAYDYIPYLVAEAYCLIFSGVIFSQLSSSLGSEHEVRELKNLIFTFFVMLVADMLWISSFAHFIDLEAPVPLLLNAITDIASLHRSVTEDSLALLEDYQQA